MYAWLMQCAIQKEFGLLYSTKANMVVVETVPNFQAKVYPVKNSHIRKGLAEMKSLLILLAEWMNKK